MAAQKPLQLVSGIPTQVAAVESSSGSGDEGKIVALNSGGLIDDTMFPPGLGADTTTAVATEALTAGDIVNVYDAAGVKSCRKADADSITKKAIGFVRANVLNAGTATIYLSGVNDQVSGLTIGAVYFLSQTAGGVATSSPTGAGVISQLVGVAGSATELLFEAQTPFLQI